MAKEPDSLVLEQRSLIRETSARRLCGMRRDLNGTIEGAFVKVNADAAIMMGFGHYIHSIDERVEHLEKMMGVGA